MRAVAAPEEENQGLEEAALPVPACSRPKSLDQKPKRGRDLRGEAGQPNHLQHADVLRIHEHHGAHGDQHGRSKDAENSERARQVAQVVQEPFSEAQPR